MDGGDYKHTVNSQEKSEQSPRRDLLRSYGSAILTIGERAYKKIEEQDGMIGWLARKLAFIAFTVFWWIRFQWLSHLSFIDKQIQTVEWIASKIFPPSERIFSKIDDLARFADSLPDKLDNVINVIGDFIGQFPGLALFDWAIEVIKEIFKGMMSFIRFIPDFCSGDAEIHRINDTGSAYERDENLKTAQEEIEEERLEGGVEILERMYEVEREIIQYGGLVSEQMLEQSTSKGDKEEVKKDVLQSVRDEKRVIAISK